MSKPKKGGAGIFQAGWDTSVIIPWLKENYGCEVVAVCGDIGQGGDELTGLEEKARKTGAFGSLRRRLARGVRQPVPVEAGAVGRRLRATSNLLGTSIARPLLAKKQVEVALAHGCDALAHGCTGKGNDQSAVRAHLQGAGAAVAGDRSVARVDDCFARGRDRVRPRA